MLCILERRYEILIEHLEKGKVGLPIVARNPKL